MLIDKLNKIRYNILYTWTIAAKKRRNRMNVWRYCMLWIKVTVHTPTAGIEPVAGTLLLAGINGYEVCDSEDFKEFLENKEVYYDYIEDDLLALKECETTVTFYVPENAQGIETILHVKSALKRMKENDTEDALGTLAVEDDTKLEEQDWENNWKQYFKPFPVGKELMIKPTWENLPDGCDRKVIEIDPSSSFGTGSHTTTRLCLEKIEQVLPRDKEVRLLDMGCGSGILGIAAEKLGAKHIVAVDIDENSARIARENYEVNHVDPSKYDVFAGNVLADEALKAKVGEAKYDFIAANIVADVIIWMSGLFKEFLKPEGKLVVSGIIAERSAEVIAALEKAGFKVVEFTESEEWAVVVLCHASL